MSSRPYGPPDQIIHDRNYTKSIWYNDNRKPIYEKFDYNDGSIKEIFYDDVGRYDKLIHHETNGRLRTQFFFKGDLRTSITQNPDGSRLTERYLDDEVIDTEYTPPTKSENVNSSDYFSKRETAKEFVNRYGSANILTVIPDPETGLVYIDDSPYEVLDENFSFVPDADITLVYINGEPRFVRYKYREPEYETAKEFVDRYGDAGIPIVIPDPETGIVYIDGSPYEILDENARPTPDAETTLVYIDSQPRFVRYKYIDESEFIPAREFVRRFNSANIINVVPDPETGFVYLNDSPCEILDENFSFEPDASISIVYVNGEPRFVRSIDEDYDEQYDGEYDEYDGERAGG